MESVHEIVREAEQNYLEGTVTLGEHVEWNMHDTLERIDAYLNSRHVSSSEDSLGREKPFFNIVTAAVNIWYRATDIDRKNIRIIADRAENTAAAFIASVHLQNWMKEARFGKFLNEWGRTLAKYGSAVVKFVEKNGELCASVIPWNRLIVDPIDFDSLPRIEKFYKTPAQLQRMATPGDPSYAGFKEEQVKQLTDAVMTRKTLDGFQKDNRSKFIELYEVHGLLSMATYKLAKGEKPLDGDENKFFQQMHTISFVSNKDGKFEDFTLYSGKEKKDPYMITHLIKEDGRTLSIGAVEHLFDAQWMQNHTVKNVKDTLDLASKLIFQTSDMNYAGRNVLNAIETGDIFIHKINEPLTQINNSKADITAFQNFGVMWMENAKLTTSTPDSIAGNTLPSGTPYSLGAYLGQQAGSLFEIMTENKGLDLEDMMREFVIPHIKTKMDTKDEVVATLDENGIVELDAMYVPRKAIRNYNARFISELEQSIKANGPIPSPYNRAAEEQQVKESLGAMGNKRAFKPDELDEKTWKEALKDFEMKAIVEVTNENTDKQAVLTTLGTVLQSIAGNPAILQDPNARLIFNAILTETGRISPIQLSTAMAATPPAQPDLGALTESLPKSNATQ